MDLFWLLLLAIGGMVVLAWLINWGRDSSLGQQNTFLFLEGFIVGMFVFLFIAMTIILVVLSRNKKSNLTIREVSERKVLNRNPDLLQD